MGNTHDLAQLRELTAENKVLRGGFANIGLLHTYRRLENRSYKEIGDLLVKGVARPSVNPGIVELWRSRVEHIEQERNYWGGGVVGVWRGMDGVRDTKELEFIGYPDDAVGDFKGWLALSLVTDEQLTVAAIDFMAGDDGGIRGAV